MLWCRRGVRGGRWMEVDQGSMDEVEDTGMVQDPVQRRGKLLWIKRDTLGYVASTKWQSCWWGRRGSKKSLWIEGVEVLDSPE